jgi:hypothetical protein
MLLATIPTFEPDDEKKEGGEDKGLDDFQDIF